MKYIIIILAIITGAYLGAQTPNRTVHAKRIVRKQVVYVSPLPTPPPKTSEVVAEIAKTFEPAGKHAIVQAINCFYSESGLRPEATNFNTNKTWDAGVAQINDVHKMTLKDRLDFRKNISKAYQIYKSRGNWSAWYAPGCRG